MVGRAGLCPLTAGHGRHNGDSGGRKAKAERQKMEKERWDQKDMHGGTHREADGQMGRQKQEG